MINMNASWSVTSEINPAWNKTGRTSFFTMGGACREAKAYVDETEKILGEIPADLTYTCMKD